jgi:hypothetical protein
MPNEVNSAPQRAVVAAVHLSSVSDLEFESSLSELRELAKTLGYEVVATFTQKRNSFDTAAYLGTGKREEMRRFVHAEEAHPDDVPQPAHMPVKRQAKPTTPGIARHGAVAAREAAKAQADAAFLRTTAQLRGALRARAFAEGSISARIPFFGVGDAEAAPASDVVGVQQQQPQQQQQQPLA